MSFLKSSRFLHGLISSKYFEFFFNRKEEKKIKIHFLIQFDELYPTIYKLLEKKVMLKF